MEGVMKGTKPCPECGIPTEKASGCNHMTCGSCHADWCWTCGHLLTNIAWHYNPGNPSGCQQFQDTSSIANSKLLKVLRCAVSPIAVLSILFFGLCGLTFVVWFPVSLLVIGVATKGDMTWVCMIASALTFVPFIIFQLVWVPVAAVINFLLCPCGASRDTFIFVVQVPFASVMALLEGGCAVLAAGAKAVRRR